MNPFKVIKRLSLKSLVGLTRLALFHMPYLLPTYKATKECMQISTGHFGREHYQNGPANAFRHALWNVLIAQRCMNTMRKLEPALRWTEKITDWHEKAFFSQTLPMKMDYHNNAIGRSLVRKNPMFSTKEYVNSLLELTKAARLITLETDLNQSKNQLVYISNGA